MIMPFVNIINEKLMLYYKYFGDSQPLPAGFIAGLRKAKKYDWKDSNLANFGSDMERDVKSKQFKIKSVHNISKALWSWNEISINERID